MTTLNDARIAELEALAASEGITLPYSASYIVWHEDNGRIVDLTTGEVIYANLVAEPAANAQAIAYLLCRDFAESQ